MKLKPKFQQARWVVLFLALGIAAYTIFSLSLQKTSAPLSKGHRTPSRLAFAKGISFVEYRGDRKVYKVSIDSLLVEKTRFGPFAINPLRVATLNKVAIDLYTIDDDLPLAEQLSGKMREEKLDLEKPVLDIRKNLPSEFRKVRRIELKEISITLWKNDEKVFRISSDSATIDRQTGDVVFTGHANLEAGENGRLQSHRIRWDRKTHLFKVTDPFYLFRDGKRTEGKGVETDYMLRRISYISAPK